MIEQYINSVTQTCTEMNWYRFSSHPSNRLIITQVIQRWSDSLHGETGPKFVLPTQHKYLHVKLYMYTYILLIIEQQAAITTQIHKVLTEKLS